jgi:anti-sigma-K factor RskA
MTPVELPHDELEELIAADALDGLSEADRDRMIEEMARHGADCADCRRLIMAYAETAGRLAMAADPLPLSAGAEDRLIELARGVEREVPAAPATVRSISTGRVRRWAATAAVAAVLALVAGAVGYALAPNGPGGGVRVASFKVSAGQTLAVAFSPGTHEAWVVGSNIAAPPNGKVYELWFQSGDTGPMHPAGTFSPTGGGVLSPVSIDPSFSLLAVSVEPPGGSPAPTSAPLFVASPPGQVSTG